VAARPPSRLMQLTATAPVARRRLEPPLAGYSHAIIRTYERLN